MCERSSRSRTLPAAVTGSGGSGSGSGSQSGSGIGSGNAWGAPKRSCLRTQHLLAKGTTKWSFDKKAKLPRGSYVVRSRAINSAGRIERKSKPRNLLQTKVRR